jgi:hypothetical protein
LHYIYAFSTGGAGGHGCASGCHKFRIAAGNPERHGGRCVVSYRFSVLTDITYRNYRSPAGRASLESAAMQLCEDYRRDHSDADIYFEDDSLRIYHIQQQTLMNAKAGAPLSCGEK